MCTEATKATHTLVPLCQARHYSLILSMQEARKWSGSSGKVENLDYSEKSNGVRGASDDSGAESINMQQKSLVDMDDFDSSDIDSQVATCFCCLAYHLLHVLLVLLHSTHIAQHHIVALCLTSAAVL